MIETSLNPYILTRKNTLTKSSINHINEKDVNSFVERNQALLEQYDEISRELLTQLEKQIGKTYDNRYLNLKRAIFNNKTNKAINLIGNLSLEECEEHLTKLFESYLLYAKEYQLIGSSIEQFYKKSLESARNTLYELAHIIEIQEYLMMIQPDIYEKLTSYLNNEPTNHKNKEKKLDGTLYKVTSRAALKTSPFANITKVGRIELGNETYNNNSSSDEKNVKVNFTFLDRVAFGYLYQSDKFYREIQYRTPPLSIQRKDKFHFVSFVATTDDMNSSKIFETSEILKTLKVIPELSEFLNSNSVRNNINFEKFKSILSTYITEDEAFDLLKKYVEIGLLVPALGFNASTDIKLCSEIDNIGQKFLSNESSNELRNLINKILATKEELSKCDSLDNRKFIYQDFQQFIDKNPLTKSLNMNVNNIFYEDGVIKKVSTEKELLTSQQFEDLKRIQTFTLLFDVGVRMRLELGETLINKGIRTLNNDFFTALFDTSKKILPYWSSPIYSANKLNSQYIVILDGLKASFLKEYTTYIEKHNEDEELDISTIVNKYQALIPKELIKEVDLSTSFFLQKIDKQIILNSIYDGQEKYKARFMDYFEDYLTYDKSYNKYVDDYYLNQNYIEYTESFGFNGNVKKIELPKKAMTIGTGRRRFAMTEEKIVKVEDLCIDASKETHMVKFHAADGESVKIVFRGSLIPTAMPGYVATLMQLFSSGRMTFKFSDLAKVEKLPRLKFNDVILARKKEILANYSAFFHPLKEESEEQFYYRILVLCKENKIPSNFFVVAKRDLSSGEFKFIDFKPFYVDLSNPISMIQFIKEIILKYKDDNYQDLFIEETLSNSGIFAEEYDLEIYKKEGDTCD